MSESDSKEDLNVRSSVAPQVGAVENEHLSINGNGAPEADDRGRHLESRQHANGIKSDQTDGVNLHVERRDQCPATLTERTRPTCATTSLALDPALAVDLIAAHGNSGDGPNEGTRCQTRIERGEESPDTSGIGTDGRQSKKRHRRRPSKKKRRWKPYYKLSWEEKKALDERETARASRVRAEMFAKGLPVAPYNTTQFIMEEHDREEPDLNTETGGRGLVGLCSTREVACEDDLLDIDDGDDGGGGGSDGIGRPGNAGGEYLQRDFSETYERYHVESLQSMTKQELVQEYLELEKCMSRLEEENARLRLAVDAPGTGADNALYASSTDRIRELESELEALRAQNKELRVQTFIGD